MRVLAIDTSSGHIATGVVEITQTQIISVASSSHIGASMHAEVLAPSISRVCHEAGTALADLDGVVVGLGPGPFTGLRVGIVTAASLGDALGLPVWGVCSLDALPAPGSDGRTLAVSDARRKEVYFAVYDGERRVGGPSVGRPEDLLESVGPTDLVLHAGADRYRDLLTALGDELVERYPEPAGLVRVAVRERLVEGPSSVLRPIYLRRPDAAEPKSKPPLDVTGPTGR